MIDIAEIISRLRSQRMDVAHRAADVIENLVSSESEARKAIDEVRKAQMTLIAKLPAEEPSLTTAPAE